MLPQALFVFLLWLLIWYLKDAIAAFGLLFLIYQWLIEDGIHQPKMDEEPLQDRLRRLLVPLNNASAPVRRHPPPPSRSAVTTKCEVDEPVLDRPLLYDAQPKPRMARRHTDTSLACAQEQETQLLEDRKSETSSGDYGYFTGRHYNDRVRLDLSSAANYSSLEELDQQFGSDGFPLGSSQIRQYSDSPVEYDDDNDEMYDVEHTEPREYDYDSDEDEFFFATDFAEPLPKCEHSQSLDYLDYVSERETKQERLCISAVDLRTATLDDLYPLRKDISTSDESDGSRPCMTSALDCDVRSPYLSSDEEVSPPVLKVRSQSESALWRQRSLSSSMLADDLDISDICHESFRGKLRGVLGLSLGKSQENIEHDTSLEFRSPHLKSQERIHKRLRRVLSSYGDDEEENIENRICLTDRPMVKRIRKHHKRTKSMPLNIQDFTASLNNEKSRSAEMLNHDRKVSAFQLYDQELTTPVEVIDNSGDEVFIDKPAIVDYQLGYRDDLPSSGSVSPIPSMYTNIAQQSYSNNRLSSSNVKGEDRRDKQILLSENRMGNIDTIRIMDRITPLHEQSENGNNSNLRISDRNHTNLAYTVDTCVHDNIQTVTQTFTELTEHRAEHTTEAHTNQVKANVSLNPLLQGEDDSEIEQTLQSGSYDEASAGYEVVHATPVLLLTPQPDCNKNHRMEAPMFQRSPFDSPADPISSGAVRLSSHGFVITHKPSAVVHPVKNDCKEASDGNVINPADDMSSRAEEPSFTELAATDMVSPHDSLARGSPGKGTGYFLRFDTPKSHPAASSRLRKRGQSMKEHSPEDKVKVRKSKSTSGINSQKRLTPSKIPKRITSNTKGTKESSKQEEINANSSTKTQSESTPDKASSVTDSITRFKELQQKRQEITSPCNEDFSVDMNSTREDKSQSDLAEAVETDIPVTLDDGVYPSPRHGEFTEPNDVCMTVTEELNFPEAKPQSPVYTKSQDRENLHSTYPEMTSSFENIYDHSCVAHSNTIDSELKGLVSQNITTADTHQRDSHKLDSLGYTCQKAWHTFAANGCQDCDTSDSKNINLLLQDNSITSETERDIDEEKVSETRRDPLPQSLQPEVVQTQNVSRTSMASSWMDRLKEDGSNTQQLSVNKDLDNDDEWLSEEEEFQREEEARRAAQQREEEEDSAEDFEEEMRQFQREQIARRKEAARRAALEDSDEDQSSDEGFEYHHGGSRQNAVDERVMPPAAAYRQNSAPARLTGSASDDEKEDKMYQSRRVDVAHEYMGRRNTVEVTLKQEQEFERKMREAKRRAEDIPDDEEMEHMVKRNLRYVKSSSLEKMDILTTDLEMESGQLKVEAGVGRLEATDSTDQPYYIDAGEQFDAMEEAVGDVIEVVGTLEPVEQQEETVLPQKKAEWRSREFGEEDDTERTTRRSSKFSESARQQLVDELSKELSVSVTAKADSEDSNSPVEEELVSPSQREIIEIVESAKSAMSEQAADASLDVEVDPHSVNVTESDICDSADGKKLIVMECEENNSAEAPKNSAVQKRGRFGWMKELTQQYDQWTDELPNPDVVNKNVIEDLGASHSGSDADDDQDSDADQQHQKTSPDRKLSDALSDHSSSEEEDEGVTSFMGRASPEEKRRMGRSQSADSDTVKERVEDHLKERIRDWRNMTPDSATDKVDEWQALGNFKVTSRTETRSEVIAQEYSSSRSEQVERRYTIDSSLLTEREEDETTPEEPMEPQYVDNSHPPSYSASLDDDSKQSDGYESDSSSQDTVREREPLTKKDEEDFGAAEEEESAQPRDKSAPMYVEIIGGEEPPDEWSNLGIKRERIESCSSSASSSSSGTGFQFIPSSRQMSDTVEPEILTEDNWRADDEPKHTRSQRERLPTPKSSADYDTQQVDEEEYQTVVVESALKQRSNRPDLAVSIDPAKEEEDTEVFDNKSGRLATPIDNPTVVFARQSVPTQHSIPEESSPPVLDYEKEPAALPSFDLSLIGQSPNIELQEPTPEADIFQEEKITLPDSQQDKKVPLTSDRRSSFERVEELKKEMRTSTKSASMDITTTRSNRANERLAERMKSFEFNRSLRERPKSSPKVGGLGGKFSAALSRFESDDSPHSSPREPKEMIDLPGRHRKPAVLDTDESIAKTPVKKSSSVPPSRPMERQSAFERTSLNYVDRHAEKMKETKTAAVEPQLRKDNSMAVQSTPRFERSQTAVNHAEPEPSLPRQSQSVDSNSGSVRGNVVHRVPDEGKSYSYGGGDNQPHFDVDIIIKREPLDENMKPEDVSQLQTTAITLGPQEVKVSKVESAPPRQATPLEEEIMNVWDTNIPVKDSREKVLQPTKLHVTQVHKDISGVMSPPQIMSPPRVLSPAPQHSRSPVSRAKSEPRKSTSRRTPTDQEISITIRPQIEEQRVRQQSSQPSYHSPVSMDEPRLRSSVVLRPQDNLSQKSSEPVPYPHRMHRQQSDPDRHHQRQPHYDRRQPVSPERPAVQHRSPTREGELTRGDSLNELRSGNLVAQTKSVFSHPESNHTRYIPSATATPKSYSKKPTAFSHSDGSSEKGWQQQQTPEKNKQKPNIKQAIADLVGAYNNLDLQNEAIIDGASRRDYNNYPHSEDNLDYTRKWVENNDSKAYDQRAGPLMAESRDEPKMPDPVRDDVAFRRQREANRAVVNKGFAIPSYISKEPSLSPAPSVDHNKSRRKEERRASIERDARPTAKVKRGPRSKSLGRKPSKAIRQMASVFQQNDQPQWPAVEQQETITPQHYRPPESQPKFSNRRSLPPDTRRGVSPKPVMQKEKSSAKPSKPVNQQTDDPELESPKAPAKGIAMMIELYNKHKGANSPLPDVDEQSLTQVDGQMFRTASAPTSPAEAVDDRPLSAAAWKAWLGGNKEKSSLEQKVERVYNHKQQSTPSKHTTVQSQQPAKPPGHWQQRQVQEEPAVRPTHVQPVNSSRPSPPRQQQQPERRGWSTSPPPPAVPQKTYYPDVTDNNNISKPAFDAYNNNYRTEEQDMINYKQESLHRYQANEDYYAKIQRPTARPDPSDQLLIQAPPPKPERLFINGREAPPNMEYNDYAQMHPQRHSEPQHIPYPASEPPQQSYNNRYPHSQQTYRDPYDQYQNEPYRNEGYQNGSRQPLQQYNKQTYQPDRHGHPQSQQQGYFGSEEPRHHVPTDSRGYNTMDPRYMRERSRSGDQRHRQNVDPRQYQQSDRRPDSRMVDPRSQPRLSSYQTGRSSDPRYTRPEEMRYNPRLDRMDRVDSRTQPRSPPTHGYPSDPRYDPRHSEPQRPRRTNSVPNINKQLSPHGRHQAPQQYDPRYQDPYHQSRHPPDSSRNQPSYHGSLPRSSKQKDRTKQSSGLPEFTPIQYATGKYPIYRQDYAPGYNNNYPADRRYPNQQAYPHHANGYSHQHPYHPDQVHGGRPRPGVGVMYNPDLGVSDF